MVMGQSAATLSVVTLCSPPAMGAYARHSIRDRAIVRVHDDGIEVSGNGGVGFVADDHVADGRRDCREAKTDARRSSDVEQRHVLVATQVARRNQPGGGR